MESSGTGTIPLESDTGQEPPGRSPLRMWIIRSMQMKYPAYRKNTENTYPSSWGWNLEFRSTQSLYTKNSFPDILLILSFFQSIRSGIRNSGHRNFKRDRHRMNTDENERKNILDELLPTRGEGHTYRDPFILTMGFIPASGRVSMSILILPYWMSAA